MRLFLDDPGALARMRPELDATRPSQVLEGVEVCRWRERFTPQDVADVVVETFGCDVPPECVQAMVGREPRARWINLEYLSAEEWVERSHGLPSPHPRLPLVRRFFFPGFTVRTGGLLRESDLLARRDAFRSDPQAQAAFWRRVAGAAPPEGAITLSVFSYAGAPQSSLLEAMAAGPLPAWCAIAGGPAREALGGAALRRGSLHAFPIPFLAQDDYDLLLWACDANFVRGEDSFVRAQWAGRPLAWHIYPQGQGAHWIKLAAFFARYGEELPAAQAAAISRLSLAWNRGEDMGAPWRDFLASRAALEAHAKRWCERLAQQRDLAAALANFSDNMLK